MRCRVRALRAALTAAAALVAAAALPSAAQTVASADGSAPPGLAVVWRTESRKLESRASAWSVDAFSVDGALVGISDETGTRILRASDGVLLRMLPAPFATGQFAYALAISSAGQIAIGRVGGVEVYELASTALPIRFDCAGGCGPVSALAFSPSGQLLAFQSARGVLERQERFAAVGVVNLRTGAALAQLEATATRAKVAFSADGRTLFAANVTQLDDSGTFGLRAWHTQDWTLTRNVPGAQPPTKSVGPFALTDAVAAYERDGKLEMRALASNELLWAVPLVPPAFETTGVAAASKLELVAFAPNGRFVISYESPVLDGGAVAGALGALVLRRADDGAVEAMYDVAAVSALVVAPDSRTFLYTAGNERAFTVLARVPQ
jgi:hypothetical protein